MLPFPVPFYRKGNLRGWRIEKDLTSDLNSPFGKETANHLMSCNIEVLN